MASSLAKIDIHLIFHVKSTSVKIQEEDLPHVFAYIGGIIRDHGGIPFEVGGRTDHIHVFCSLPKAMSLSDFVRIIKSFSSKWLKTVNERYVSFSWQDGYGAFSVSPSLANKTIDYIRHQEEHHKKRTFKEEYELFLKAYGIQYDERYAFDD